MLIRSPKDWELPSAAVTSERDYALRPRRDFLKTLAVGAAGAVLGPRSLLAATTGFPAKENPNFPASALKPTPYEHIISYNNFYEFGTEKDEPKSMAKRWKPEPWTVELAGLIRNPTKLDVNELITKMGGLEERVYRMRCVEAWSMVIPWDGFPLANLVKLADPQPEARFLKMTTLLDPKNMPGEQEKILEWPYVEGLHL